MFLTQYSPAKAYHQEMSSHFIVLFGQLAQIRTKTGKLDFSQLYFRVSLINILSKIIFDITKTYIYLLKQLYG
jgi:hypothetical protein